jgi:hypothetical protein
MPQHKIHDSHLVHFGTLVLKRRMNSHNQHKWIFLHLITVTKIQGPIYRLDLLGFCSCATRWHSSRYDLCLLFDYAPSSVLHIRSIYIRPGAIKDTSTQTWQRQYHQAKFCTSKYCLELSKFTGYEM